MVAKRDDSEAFAHLHRPALCNGWQHRNTNGSTMAYTVEFLWTAMYIHAKTCRCDIFQWVHWIASQLQWTCSVLMQVLMTWKCVRSACRTLVWQRSKVLRYWSTSLNRCGLAAMEMNIYSRWRHECRQKTFRSDLVWYHPRCDICLSFWVYYLNTVSISSLPCLQLRVFKCYGVELHQLVVLF